MGWIQADKRLPPAGQKVVAYYKTSHGHDRRIMGFYVPRHTVEVGPDEEINFEWSDDEYTCWLLEGWYEQLENWEDYGSVAVYQGTVTHWMEMPDPPEGK